jgi:DNA-binding CsgD family transcriptional regulator
MGILKDVLGILFIIILLGAGAASILIPSGLYRKYRQPFLQSYQYYQFLTVIFGIYGLIGSLLAQRILQSLESAPKMIITVGQVIPFIGIPFLIIGLYLFIKMCLEMTGKTISRRFTLIYFLFHLLFFLIYGLVLLKLHQKETDSYTLFPAIIRFTLIILQTVIMAIAAFILFKGARQLKNTPRSLRIRNFAFWIISLQAVVLVLFLLSDRSIYLTLAYLLLYFIAPLPPLLYLAKFQDINWNRTSPAGEMASLAEYYAKNEITRREKEIIELILKGLTNQEIADSLFITLQTVKDHTHNIFLKTGVRNRVELINIIRGFKKV